MAGVIFIEAEQALEGDDTAETPFAAWLERGMGWDAKTASLQWRAA